MGILDRLGIGRKDSAAARLAVSALLQSGEPVWMRTRPEVLAREGYKRNSWVFGCVDGISKAGKGIPWTLYRPDGAAGQRALRHIKSLDGMGRRERIEKAVDNGELKEVDAHPLLDLLATPNPEMGGGAFTQAKWGFWLITGMAYVEAAGPKVGPPRELWPLRTDRVKIIPDTTGRIGRYRYQVGSEWTDFTPRQVLMHKFFNPEDDWYGMSPLEAAARAVDRDNASEAWNTGLLQNGGRPAGAFVTEGTLDQSQRVDLRTQMREKIEGPHNAGRALVLDGGLKWEEMGLSPRDMDWIEGQKWSLKRICAVYGYPMPLLDPEASATYANYEEARKALYMDTVLPLKDQERDDYQRWLVPQFGDDLILGYDKDCIEALQEDRAQAWTRSDDVRLSLDERREAVGMDALPNGKGQVMLIPATTQVIPLDEIGDPPPAPVADPNADPAAKPADGKSFNLRDEQRAAYHADWERILQAWETQFEKRAAARFAGEGRKVAAAIEGAGDVDAARRVVHELPQGEWRALYVAMLSAIAMDFGDRTLAGLIDAGKAEEPTWWQQGAQRWVLQVAGERITGITTTTKAVLQDIISEGVKEGWSMPRIATAVREAYSSFTKARSLLIARTETIGASNAGAMFAAQSTGLQLTKQWLATIDERTRPHHLEADGQEREMHDAFIVGGVPMQHPGDPSAPPSEVCNCRCTVTFKTA